MIGEQIKKYRVKKGLTQEELGNMIGVTTQAVSKWERGGSPDAEILPAVAKSLGITLNMLFGESDNIQSLDDTLAEEILSMEHDKGIKRLYSLIWKIGLGLSGMDTYKKNVPDSTMGVFIVDMPGSLDSDKKAFADGDTAKGENGYHYYARASLNEGMLDAKVDDDFSYIFFMPEPKEGYAKTFENTEELQNVFSVLAEKDILKILFFMYSRQNLPSSSSLIASGTNIGIEKVEMLMDKLCSINLANRTPVFTEKGEMKVYTYYNETVITPMLCNAKELMDQKVIHRGVWFDRRKPLF